MGKYEEATKTYRKAMEIEPHNINYGISKNNVIEKLGRHEVASAFYKKLWNWVVKGYSGMKVLNIDDEVFTLRS